MFDFQVSEQTCCGVQQHELTPSPHVRFNKEWWPWLKYIPSGFQEENESVQCLVFLKFRSARGYWPTFIRELVFVDSVSTNLQNPSLLWVQHSVHSDTANQPFNSLDNWIVLFLTWLIFLPLQPHFLSPSKSTWIVMDHFYFINTFSWSNISSVHIFPKGNKK